MGRRRPGVKPGTTVEYYTSNTGSAPLVAQIVQFNLKQIGLNVNSHLFARAVQIDKEGTRGEPFDITSEGWIADYADPYDFINVLLSGRQPPRLEQQQRRVLQRPDVQQADAVRRPAVGESALQGVRQPRRHR